MKNPFADPVLIKELAVGFVRLTAINSLVSLLVTYVMHINFPLWINWVFSMCIGFSTATFARTARHLIWQRRKPHPLGFTAVCLAVAPLGVITGTLLGASLLRYDMDRAWFINWQYAKPLVILTIVVSAIATWFFWNRLKLLELQAAAEAEKAKTAAIEKQALQTQLQMLQAQIEPHMLFNTLANLQGLITLDPERAQHMLSQLIHFLRATLSNARAASTTLQAEFDLLAAYLELLNILMGLLLTYQIDLPASLSQQTIAPMLLQPLVENAIKHGLEPKVEGGEVRVSATLQAEYLELSVTDSGLGLSEDFNSSRPAATSGFQLGNQNLSARLVALYGDLATFSLKNQAEHGCCATIRIPLAALKLDSI